MNTRIHPTAIVSNESQIGEGVTIGPYSVIGPHVHIGEGTEVRSHVVIEGYTTIGCHNRFFQFSSIGAEPQDYTYKGEPTRLEIGDGNTFREGVTVNCGTLKQEGVTVIGSNSLFMAYVHFGHDVVVGNNCTIANSVNLAGHVRIKDNVIIGGSSAVAQFVSIGQGAYITGLSGVDRDIPTFCYASGNHTRLKGVNIIGMKRQQFSRQFIGEVVDFLKSMEASSLSPRLYIESALMSEEFKENSIITQICHDIQSSKIGIAPFEN